LSAAKHCLDNLCVLVDYNKLQSYARVDEVLGLEPFADKFASFGFTVREVDGHDLRALRETFAALPFTPGKPSAVICHTVKGMGVDFAENNLEWHHKSSMPDRVIEELMQALERAACAKPA